MGRAERLTSVLKRYDPLLYCENSVGKLCVYRKGQRIETYDVDGNVIHFVRSAPFFIFALTDTWAHAGEPVDRGIEPILQRIKDIDLWNRNLAEEIIEQKEKEEKITAKDRKNETEAFLKDFRGQFAKTFNDVNTASMDKKDLRKIGEKNGSY